MNKKCLNCNKDVISSMNFCPYCGSSSFTEMGGADNRDPSEYYTPSSPHIPQKVKVLKPWQSVIITIIVLVLFFSIGFFGTILLNNEALFSDYNKGEIINNEYVNEWANIKFEITSDWPLGDSDAFDKYEDEWIDCGFASRESFSGEEYVLYFDDIYAYDTEYNTDTYIEEYAKATVSDYEFYYDDFDVSETFNINIANERYRAFKVELNDLQLTEYFCARVFDGRAIVFNIYVHSEEDAIKFFNSVTTVNQSIESEV